MAGQVRGAVEGRSELIGEALCRPLLITPADQPRMPQPWVATAGLRVPAADAGGPHVTKLRRGPRPGGGDSSEVDDSTGRPVPRVEDGDSNVVWRAAFGVTGAAA